MDSTQIAELARKHLSIWNEANEGVRTPAMKEVYAPQAKIIDPFFEVTGHGPLNGLIADLHKQYPGYKLRMTTPVESHHNVGRFFWQFGPTEAPGKITGQDVFKIENGLISELFVFIDKAENK
jgi:hypothetical protein